MNQDPLPSVDEMIAQYARLAAGLSRLICAKYAVDYPLQIPKALGWKRFGRLNRKVYFKFHGAGCLFMIRRVKFKSCRTSYIDVDYYGHSMIFDVWRLSRFLNDAFDISTEKQTLAENIERWASNMDARFLSFHEGNLHVDFRTYRACKAP